jgi:hypothetical protein
MYLLMLIDLKVCILYVGFSIQAYIFSGKKNPVAQAREPIFCIGFAQKTAS